MFKAKDAAMVDKVALFVVSVSSVVGPFDVAVGVIVAILPSVRLIKETIQRVIPASFLNPLTFFVHTKRVKLIKHHNRLEA